jgi:hypothetical protein
VFASQAMSCCLAKLLQQTDAPDQLAKVRLTLLQKNPAFCENPDRDHAGFSLRY